MTIPAQSTKQQALIPIGQSLSTLVLNIVVVEVTNIKIYNNTTLMTSGYSIASNTITFSPPITATTVAITITVVSSEPYAKEFDFTEAAQWNSVEVNKQLNRLALEIQQLRDLNAFKNYDYDLNSLYLPDLTRRRNTMFTFDDNGDPDVYPFTPPGPTSLFIQTGTGAISRTYLNKVREQVSVQDFGAIGDGVNDDTSAIQLALNSGHRTVYIPEGTYLVSQLTIPANIILFGDGVTSILKQTTNANMLVLDSGSSTTTISNIEICNLKLLGEVTTKAFSEFVHLIAFYGVSNFHIHDCTIEGFRGDGIYIGNGSNERHNKNVCVSNCVINGVNSDNRNGISVIDCDGFIAHDNYFVNISRFNMPGAIDVEPNNAYNIVRNIKVYNNTFYNIGGNVAIVGIVVAPGLAISPVTNIVIRDNNFRDSSSPNNVFVGVGYAPTNTSISNGIVIANNYGYNCGQPVFIRTGKGILIEGNTFENSRGGLRLGYLVSNMPESYMQDVIIQNNNFMTLGGTENKGGIIIFKCDRLKILNNIFNDCGTGISSSYAIEFNEGFSSYVHIIGNTIMTPTGRTLRAIIKETQHTLNPSTNILMYNDFNGLDHTFVAFRCDNTGSPIQTYTPSNVYADFPFGTSIAIINGATPGLPPTTPAYTQGLLKTEKYTTSAGLTGWIIQYFYPRRVDASPTTLNKYFWRKSDQHETGTWSNWVEVAGTELTPP